jgi:hypothetical protein
MRCPNCDGWEYPACCGKQEEPELYSESLSSRQRSKGPFGVPSRQPPREALGSLWVPFGGEA